MKAPSVAPAAPAFPASLADLRGAFDAGDVSAGELACAFVVRAVRARAGVRWSQGARTPGLECASAREEARVVASTRLHRVDQGAAAALAGWAGGRRPAALRFDVPTADEVLAVQAGGGRYVSLLAEGAPTGKHADPLAFALHDLCHLEKFVDPEHHEGQVGFFAAALRARGDVAWAAYERSLDAAWFEDRDAVTSDMNGSCVFLFSAFKMKLKMAVRRKLARAGGYPEPRGGALCAGEAGAFDEALSLALAAFGVEGAAADAARRVSTKYDAPSSALFLLGHFTARGRACEARP